MSSISEVFGRWQLQESEYVVHAGFDESLISSGIGYLEQIHVFTIAEIDATSPLLSELGKLFSPFSSILFTESSTYHLPVYKDDGSVWEFDELVYFTASKFADDGSNAKTPLSVIGFSQTPVSEGVTGFSSSGSGSGSGEEEKSKKRRSEKGKGRDMGDEDEDEANEDPNPSDDPDDPPGDQGGIIAEPVKISFEIATEIQDDDQNTFQTLTMHGGLTIKVVPPHYHHIVSNTKLIFTHRQHHWLRIHSDFQNALFNSLGLHLGRSEQQILHISNSTSGLLLIHNRRMPTLRSLNQRGLQILMGRKCSHHH